MDPQGGFFSTGERVSQVDAIHSIHSQWNPQAGYGHLADVLDKVCRHSVPLMAQLRLYRVSTRPGYAPEAMWRAYISAFILNLPHTNALIRRLQDDEGLRQLCWLPNDLPPRTTFNRFIQRLARHANLVQACLARLTDELKALIPDLGGTVAIDSSFVRTHSNPDRRRPDPDNEGEWIYSDPEAKVGAKEVQKGKRKDRSVWFTKGNTEYHFGYKVHMAADAVYGIPLGLFVTPANVGDNPTLPDLMKQVQFRHRWFRPSVVIADKGYDSKRNHNYLNDQGIIPIIAIKRNPRGKLREGIYTDDGVPTCLGLVPMEYVRSDPDKGHLYRCRGEGCHLKNSRKGGVLHCDAEVWEDPTQDIRMFGVIRRGSAAWKELYEKRQAIERIFKSKKESRRLEDHCVRGLANITLHSTMSSIAFQATALANIEAGERERMRWMVRKVA